MLYVYEYCKLKKMHMLLILPITETLTDIIFYIEEDYFHFDVHLFHNKQQTAFQLYNTIGYKFFSGAV